MKLVVVGAGTMGSGIAYASATAGHNVVVVEQDQKFLDQGMKRIQDYVAKGVARGVIDKSQATAIQSRLQGTVDFNKACQNADFIVEAVFEDPKVKEQVFATLDKVSPPRAILASNTSSISISKLARSTKRPGKVLGLHFFNPVPTMKLVELIRGENTSEETVTVASKFVQSLGKTLVQSADKTGFIVNRALMPFINESIKLLDEKVASREDIDKAFTLGTNHPMGPLQLADFIGLDVVLSTLKVLQAEYGECFEPAKTLTQMVTDGKLGRKTGRGFYDY
jgi:3-hydroxybutyryl-CoA dehydrogenase